MPKVNAAGLDLIKTFEGLSFTAYQDSGGVWTIGYGHTGTDVHEGLTITQVQADALLDEDLTWAEFEVQRAIEIVLTPNQFSALVSWEFNTGALADSPGLALVNERRFEEAWDDHFCLWIHAGGTVLEGLVRRRAAERALFFTPD